MKLRLSLLFLATAAFTFLTACGSSGPVGIKFSTAPTTVNAGGTANFTVTVSNSGQGVKWSLQCGTASNPVPQCGTLVNSTNTSTGYQAPTSVLTGTVVLVATSSQDSSKTAQASFTVGPASTVALADGNYVFQLQGSDSNGVVNVAGVITIASGAITTGEQDFNDFSNVVNDGITAAGSSITAAADGNITIVLNTNDSAVGVNGIETFSMTPTSTTSGLLTWFDASGTTASGTQTAQNTTAAATAPSGGYSFATGGFDGTGCIYAMGGVLSISSSTIAASGSGSIIDLNDCYSSSSNQTLLTGPVGTLDNFGRTTFTLNLATPIVLAGYITDTSIALVETSDNFGGDIGGTAYAQSSSDVGKFTLATLTGQSGTAYALGAQGCYNSTNFPPTTPKFFVLPPKLAQKFSDYNPAIGIKK
jgi:hypothetical protein